MSREAGGEASKSERQEQKREEEGKEVLERAKEAAEEIYHLRDTFFPSDPAEKAAALTSLADAAVALLDSLPPANFSQTMKRVMKFADLARKDKAQQEKAKGGKKPPTPKEELVKELSEQHTSSPASKIRIQQRKSPQQRAVYEFLRGKILDAFPDYHKEAEDHLSKAVKLNPSLVDAWLCLGNCIWKKGDMASAKNCFSLALSKGADKKILCQLSMLERSMSQGTENQALLVEESIKHAKEAVMLDIKDGNSWYNLGNAYLTSFFVTGAWDHIKLHHSVKAYQNAEKDEVTKLNPDLYYNCATADKYLENYERALRGFEAAALKDPGLGAGVEVQKIISLLDKLENAMKGQVRSKRLASLVSSLGEVNLKSSHKKATISVLSEGLNKPLAVLGKVLLLIKHDNVAPLYYLTCDLDQSYFILSVYGLQNEAIKEGDRVTLLEPNYRVMDIQWKEKHYQLKSIRVDFPEQILVNEKVPAHHHVVRASIHAQNKP